MIMATRDIGIYFLHYQGSTFADSTGLDKALDKAVSKSMDIAFDLVRRGFYSFPDWARNFQREAIDPIIDKFGLSDDEQELSLYCAFGTRYTYHGVTMSINDWMGSAIEDDKVNSLDLKRIHYKGTIATENNIKKAKLLFPEAIKNCFDSLSKKINDWDYGLAKGYEGIEKFTNIEVLSIAHHKGVCASTVSGALYDDLISTLEAASWDLGEVDLLTLRINSTPEEEDSYDESDSDISSYAYDYLDIYLENIYESDHVQSLMEQKDFLDHLALLNIDQAHAMLDESRDWLDPEH